MSIKSVRQASFTNDFFKKEKKHYVTLFVVSEHYSGEPELKEPDKCVEWKWFSWYNFPEPLFLSMQNLLKQGFDPFTSHKL